MSPGTAVPAFNLYPAGGFLGYTDNKWDDPAISTGATVPAPAMWLFGGALAVLGICRRKPVTV
jgi:hypothetical protein